MLPTQSRAFIVAMGAAACAWNRGLALRLHFMLPRVQMVPP